MFRTLAVVIGGPACAWLVGETLIPSGQPGTNTAFVCQEGPGARGETRPTPAPNTPATSGPDGDSQIWSFGGLTDVAVGSRRSSHSGYALTVAMSRPGFDRQPDQAERIWGQSFLPSRVLS